MTVRDKQQELVHTDTPPEFSTVRLGEGHCFRQLIGRSSLQYASSCVLKSSTICARERSVKTGFK